MTSCNVAPAAASASVSVSTHAAACPATSPTAAVEPSSSSGQAPARKMSRASFGAVAAYAYSATDESVEERMS